MTVFTQGDQHVQVKNLVARALLESITNNPGNRSQLTQTAIAAQTGADWITVHKSLMSLQCEGAIRIERNRMMINREMLQKAARI